MESKAPVRHPLAIANLKKQRQRSAKQDVSLMKAWRETRAASMQPRDDSAPTAKQRMDALRARLVARGDAAGSS